MVVSQVRRLPPLPSPKDLLRMYNIRSSKRLSQNFLLDPQCVDRIARLAGPLEGKSVVEVGPGPGSITRALIGHGAREVHVIEKDRRFLPSLQLLREASGDTLVVHLGNALRFNMSRLFPDDARRSWNDPVPPPVRLVSNLPFNIASPFVLQLIRAMERKENLFSYGRVPMLLTFQAEVAERIVAAPSDVNRSRLSVIVQNYAQVRLKQVFSGGAFVPTPAVDVGLVSFLPLRQPYIDLPFHIVNRVVTAAFHGKRKQLWNSLKILFPKDSKQASYIYRLLETSSIKHDEQAINLNLSDFERLCIAYDHITKEEPNLAKYLNKELELKLLFPGEEHLTSNNTRLLAKSKMPWLGVLLLLILPLESSSVCQPNQFSPFLPPTVTIGILVSSKASILPYFLSHLEALDYCKERLSLLIKTDHNNDLSLNILAKWKASVEHLYHSIDLDASEDINEIWTNGWTDARYAHIIDLKEQVLSKAKIQWTQFLWLLDADVLLVDNQTLNALLEIDSAIVAPMLTSVGLYSNFWAGMNDQFYYVRTEEYLPILERKNRGCHVVPMVHSAVLIDLTMENTWHLSFRRETLRTFTSAPNDDIIVFALSANESHLPMKICNDKIYGYIMPSSEDYNHEEKNLESLKLQVIADGKELKCTSLLKEFVPPNPIKSRLGMDAVYLINLARRGERRLRMEQCFDILGIEHELFNAIDGQQIDENFLEKEGIKMLDEFSEPFHQRVLTMGEIGCFMSHYRIWQDMIEKQHAFVMVLEDDIRFEPYFKENLAQVLEEVKQLELRWDLIYLGRKILHDANESWVQDSDFLVHPDYTYWTLAYLISSEGASKLIAEEPKGKMVPVDEYLPIMYDRHPNKTWKASFKNRDLRVYSVQPLLVHPTQYTGEEGYFSDTEDSITIDDHVIKRDEL